MPISAEQVKNNFDEYLRRSMTEDILITVDGRVVAKLVNPNQDKVNIVKSLMGSLPDSGMTVDDIKRERLARA